MSASDTQIGGDHYKAMGEFQPWDVLAHWLTPEEYRGYQKGVAIAYLAREKAKGGDQDIRKAVHHLQRLVEELDKAAAPAPASSPTIATMVHQIMTSPAYEKLASDTPKCGHCRRPNGDGCDTCGRESPDAVAIDKAADFGMAVAKARGL